MLIGTFNAHFSGMSNGNIDEAISHALNIIPDVDEFSFHHNAFDLPAIVSALEALWLFTNKLHRSRMLVIKHAAVARLFSSNLTLSINGFITFSYACNMINYLPINILEGWARKCVVF